ncbi:hypothetical protein, partial [Kocuria salsicia]|uniref:hypothetical protein n=1 Tax=Kocuria salsicia TaxID=664639 RepID=UPI001C92EAC3
MTVDVEGVEGVGDGVWVDGEVVGGVWGIGGVGVEGRGKVWRNWWMEGEWWRMCGEVRQVMVVCGVDQSSV